MKVVFNHAQVALKRQQAAEDAIAMGLRAVATGAPMNGYLPPGPIFGMPVTEPLVSDDQNSSSSIDISDVNQTSEDAVETNQTESNDKTNNNAEGKDFLFAKKSK